MPRQPDYSVTLVPHMRAATIFGLDVLLISNASAGRQLKIGIQRAALKVLTP
ncbi:MAG: hypothetical protein WCC37_20360 [Candidatus Sulfotelmatobacter sp.]